ncbi:LysR family transcriptional regulator [Paenibacillus sp. CMAA1364]
MIVDSLRVFVTVTEQRHFSKAAKLLNLSQPGVSLHIRNLENEMGAKLLHRSSKQVRLTEAGEILYKRAKQMMILYDEATQLVHLLQNEVTGTLQIGASYTIGEYILPQKLAEFANQYPQVEIQVNIANTEEIIQGVRSGVLDIGIIEGQTYATDLSITPYMKDTMIVVASNDHPLSTIPVIEPKALQNQVWVTREDGSGTRNFSNQFIKMTNLNVKRSYILNSNQAIKEAVMSGLGIAILSRWVVKKELESGDISELRIKDNTLERELSIILHQERTTTMAVDVFMKSLLTVNSYLTADKS